MMAHLGPCMFQPQGCMVLGKLEGLELGTFRFEEACILGFQP